MSRLGDGLNMFDVNKSPPPDQDKNVEFALSLSVRPSGFQKRTLMVLFVRISSS